MVGGENANNEEIQEKRIKRKKHAEDERKRQLISKNTGIFVCFLFVCLSVLDVEFVLFVAMWFCWGFLFVGFIQILFWFLQMTYM